MIRLLGAPDVVDGEKFPAGCEDPVDGRKDLRMTHFDQPATGSTFDNAWGSDSGRWLPFEGQTLRGQMHVAAVPETWRASHPCAPKWELGPPPSDRADRQSAGPNAMKASTISPRCAAAGLFRSPRN